MLSPLLNIRPSYMPKYVPTSSCVLYLPGQDDPQSTTIRDRSGKGNHGTISGAVWTRLSWGLWCLGFDGAGAADDYIDCGSAASLDDLTTFTWEGWFYPTGVGGGGGGRLFDKNTKRLNFISANIIRMTLTAATTNCVTTPSTSLTYNVWTLIRVTYDDTGDRKARIYYNDVECAYTGQTAAVGALDSDAASPMRIGNTVTDPRGFAGYIALPRINNTTLGGHYRQERPLFGV